MFFFLIIFISYILFELFIFFSLKKFKKNFQWLITEEDEFPVFDKIKFQRFKINSLDEKLGGGKNLKDRDLKPKNIQILLIITELKKKKTKLISSLGTLMFIVITQMTDLLVKQISKK